MTVQLLDAQRTPVATGEALTLSGATTMSDDAELRRERPD